MRSIRNSAKGRRRIRQRLPRIALAARPRGLRAWGLTVALLVGSVAPVAGSLASPAGAATQGGSCNGFSGAKALGASYTDSELRQWSLLPRLELGISLRHLMSGNMARHKISETKRLGIVPQRSRQPPWQLKPSSTTVHRMPSAANTATPGATAGKSSQI